MDESDTEEQDDDMLDPRMLAALSQQLEDVTVPIHTPPGELVLPASSVGHAGISWSNNRFTQLMPHSNS
eukprot:12430716-Prorocentrum_lima.AAC.1